jgi:hypothetical protein
LLAQPPPPSDQNEFNNLAELFDHVTVYADGQECGTLSLVNPVDATPDGGALFELGQPGQHPYCSNPMALVTVVDKNGFTLDEKWTIDPGSTVVVDNFAPEPPHGASAQILIPVFLGGRQDTAERFDHFTVLADGQVCGVISLTHPATIDQQGNIAFRPGGSGQPTACGREGTLLYFKDRNGTTLLATFTLEHGNTYLLRNFAPPPPHGPGPTETPMAPTVGTGYADGGASGSVAVVGCVVLVASLLLTLTFAGGRERKR